MSVDRLDTLRRRAHRTAVRLVTVAGVTTGLLAGIGTLLLDSSPRASVAIWALGLAVAGTIVTVAGYLRRSAEDLHAIAAELHASTSDTRGRHVETLHAIGLLRNRVAVLEKELLVLRAGQPLTAADVVGDAAVVDDTLVIAPRSDAPVTPESAPHP